MAKRQSALENMEVTLGFSSQFWCGKRVFLTGHTGFKGSWLSLWLSKLGAQVTGYALAPQTTPNLFEAADVAPCLHQHITGDVRDLQSLIKAMQQSSADIVIHMAAQPLVRYSYDNPVETYATNVMGSVHVLEAVRQTPSVRAVVNVTTDKCYENKEWHWAYRENEALGGHDPYSNSKACAELVTSAYRQSFFPLALYAQHGVAIASARAGNVIGGGDWAQDRLIPDIMRAIVKGEPVQIRNPSAVRPWQHVLEPLAGYLQLAQALYTQGTDFAQAWNFGPSESDAKPVQWIVEQLTAHWGKGASWALDAGKHHHEATYLKLDCAKAHALLNWRAAWPLNTALVALSDWYQAHAAGNDMQAFSLKQIHSYEQAIGSTQS